MKILYVNSDIIKKNDMVWGILENTSEADIYPDVVCMNEIRDDERERLERAIEDYDCVMSQNFIPVVSHACNSKCRLYASWIYDSPQYHLYDVNNRFDTNFVFAFDKSEVKRLKEMGYENVFYLPMAANIKKASEVSITEDDISKYACDVSFIGSLYDESNHYSAISRFPKENREEIENHLGELFFTWGNGLSIYDRMSDETEMLFSESIDVEQRTVYNINPGHAAKTLTLCYEMANRERRALLRESAKRFDTSFFTKNPERYSDFGDLRISGPVYEDELYKAYYASKINLNITMRSIETGIPLRVFDIMAVGGCVFTNYQEEVGELFNIDKDLIVFSSMDEYLDKADYYLKHDDLRTRVGINGYLRVRDEYNVKNAIGKMIAAMSGAK